MTCKHDLRKTWTERWRKDVIEHWIWQEFIIASLFPLRISLSLSLRALSVSFTFFSFYVSIFVNMFVSISISSSLSTSIYDIVTGFWIIKSPPSLSLYTPSLYFNLIIYFSLSISHFSLFRNRLPVGYTIHSELYFTSITPNPRSKSRSFFSQISRVCPISEIMMTSPAFELE